MQPQRQSVYADENLLKTQFVLFEQLKKYWQACENENNFMPAVESAISDALIPKLEQDINTDRLKHGIHDVCTDTYNNQRVLITNSVGFMPYQVAKMRASLPPTTGVTTMANEGKILYGLIEDYQRMDIEAFANKHYAEPPYQQSDLLIKNLSLIMDMLPDSTDPKAPLTCNVNIIKATPTSVKGQLSYKTKQDSRVAYAVEPFVKANPKHFPKPHFEGEKLMMPTGDTNGFMTNITLTFELEKDKETNLYLPTKMQWDLTTYERMGVGGRIYMDDDVKISREAAVAFGKGFQEHIVPTPKFQKRMDEWNQSHKSGYSDRN